MRISLILIVSFVLYAFPCHAMPRDRILISFDNDYTAEGEEIFESKHDVGFGKGGSGSALRLNGCDSRLEFYDGFALGREFSVSLWIKAESDGFVFTLGSEKEKRIFFITRSLNKLNVYLFDRSSQKSLQSNDFSNDNWVHAACVCNGNTAALYINGKKVAEEDFHYQEAVGGPLAAIGALADKGKCGMTGLVDEFCIYDGELKESEIAGLYAKQLKSSTKSSVEAVNIDETAESRKSVAQGSKPTPSKNEYNEAFSRQRDVIAQKIEEYELSGIEDDFGVLKSLSHSEAEAAEFNNLLSDWKWADYKRTLEMAVIYALDDCSKSYMFLKRAYANPHDSYGYHWTYKEQVESLCGSEEYVGSLKRKQEMDKELREFKNDPRIQAFGFIAGYLGKSFKRMKELASSTPSSSYSSSYQDSSSSQSTSGSRMEVVRIERVYSNKNYDSLSLCSDKANKYKVVFSDGTKGHVFELLSHDCYKGGWHQEGTRKGYDTKDEAIRALWEYKH